MESRWISGMAGAAMLALAACNEGGSPTEPTPADPTGSLVGEWHGAMSHAGGACVSEDVDAAASLDGNGVRLEVQSLCIGRVVFRLNERPPFVSGKAEVVFAGLCDSVVGPVNRPTLAANVSGTMDGGRLHLETTPFTYILARCSRPAVTLELAR